MIRRARPTRLLFFCRVENETSSNMAAAGVFSYETDVMLDVRIDDDNIFRLATLDDPAFNLAKAWFEDAHTGQVVAPPIGWRLMRMHGHGFGRRRHPAPMLEGAYFIVEQQKSYVLVDAAGEDIVSLVNEHQHRFSIGGGRAFHVS